MEGGLGCVVIANEIELLNEVGFDDALDENKKSFSLRSHVDEAVAQRGLVLNGHAALVVEPVFDEREQWEGEVFKGDIVGFLVLKHGGGNGEYGARG
ncbi:MAG: hypothetical protein WCT12_33790, partial [Verrucomicrobiota bacterium]